MSDRTPNRRRGIYVPTNEFLTPPLQLSLSAELKQVLNERNLLTVKSRAKVCSMLDDSSSPNLGNEMDKRKSLRHKAIEEILSSEKSYLKQLDILMTYFVNPLKEIIDRATHTSLFGQIEMIYNLNGELLKELEDNLDNVAPAFLKLAPFFKIYSVYAFDYKQALLILQDLFNNKSAFRKFLYNTETRPEVQTKLNSLLIVPIQRIPRYRLLLQQVCLYTSPSDIDFKILQESVKEIEKTVSHINSVIEDQENTQILLNLQNSLINRTPNIVKPSRKIIKEGILMKMSSSGQTLKRYCILMSDIFMYCKIMKERPKNTLIDNALQCSCIFPLKKCKVMEIFPGNFKITCQGDGIILTTDDIRLSCSWVAALKETIDLHIQCRQTLRKESSKRKPIRKKELKNFETDVIMTMSPNKRKFEYDSVFRCASSDSEEEKDTSTGNFSCFNLRPHLALKRKNRSPVRPHDNMIKSAKIPKIIDQSNNKERNVKLNDENTPIDSTYGFNNFNELKSLNIRVHDVLYPLRESTESNKSELSQTSSILKKPTSNINDFSGTDDDTQSIRSNSSNETNKKRVQFDFGKTEIVNKNNNLTFDDYQTDGYRFPYLVNSDLNRPTIKERISRFFSNLF